MQYRREIDGLRALAVLPVILFHAGYHPFAGGFVGVDVFFVISGYLITSIILSDLVKGRFTIADFYERRARRILPALFLVMFLCLPFAWLWLQPDDMKDFSESLVSVSLYVSNILFWRESGYFQAAAELKPLLHTWSLAVEEQFYIFFPVMMILAWRWGRRWVPAILVIGLLASFAISQWGVMTNPAGAFFLLPARGWELLAGGLAAYYLHHFQAPGSPVIREVGSGLGIILVLIAIFTYDEGTSFPGVNAILPVLGTTLIILFASPATLAGRALGLKPMVGIGLISYSAYLWHQPLFAYARHRSIEPPTDLLFAVLSVVSLVLAYFSWKYVEAPFRDKRRFTRRTIFTLALLGSGFFIVIGILGAVFADRYAAHWLARQPEQFRQSFLLLEDARANKGYAMRGPGGHGDAECRMRLEHITAGTERRLLKCFEQHGPGFVILGDSHAIDLFGIALLSSERPFVVGVSQGACRPHTPRPKCHYSDFLSLVERHPQIFKLVAYEQAGFYLLRTAEREGERWMFDRLHSDAPVEGMLIDERHVGLVHDYLSKVSEHVPVVWFGSRVEPHIRHNLILHNGCDHPYELRPNQREMFERLDEYIGKLVGEEKSLKFISQNKLFDLQFPRDFMSCDELYWHDGDHLSEAGERYMAERFDVLSIFQEALR